MEQARWEEAEVLLRSSLAKKEHVARQQRKADSGSSADMAGVSKTENLLAELAHKRGALEEARALYTQVIASRTADLGDSHAELAKPLNNLGELHATLGEFRQAELCYRRAFDVRCATLGPEHTETAKVWN